LIGNEGHFFAHLVATERNQVERSFYMKCSICGNEIKGYSNNADPITYGVCCGACNENVVLPVRLFNSGWSKTNALLIKTDGTVEMIKPECKKFALKELQQCVDGYIEIYPSRNKKIVILVNEEGLLHQLPYNKLAEKILAVRAVGNVLIGPAKLFE